MKKFESRQYQIDCAEAWYKDIKSEQCFPLVAVPTGAGKTVILSLMLKKYFKDNPHNSVLVLSHTEDIVSQDASTLSSFFPSEPIGVYNASLGRKEVEQITVGSIQSVYRNKDLFKWVNLIVIDEAHAVSHKNEGMYRKLLAGTHAILAGMSATVFRVGHGYIHQGDGRLFNKLSFDLSSKTEFNKLIKDGYLCNLRGLDPEFKLDSTGVKKSGGDYNIKHSQDKHNKDPITRAAVLNAIKHGKDRKKWLVFAIGIDHANAVARMLNRNGVKAAALHSKTTIDDSLVKKSFKDGNIQALVSVAKITTGFDEPSVDLIVMLRPTLSAVLHVQMLGRGTRPFPGKKDCLVLDYAGNLDTLGPINNVAIPKAPKKTGVGGQAPTKTCPECRTICAANSALCDHCGHKFIRKIKLLDTASTKKVIEDGLPSGRKDNWLTVRSVSYHIGKRYGRPDILVVTYICGIKIVRENWCIDHTGVAGRIGKHKAMYRGHKGPLTCAEVLKRKDNLRVPKRILVDFSSQYPQITNSEF